MQPGRNYSRQKLEILGTAACLIPYRLLAVSIPRKFFLWLTDNANYVLPATGDSRNFCTREGRVYQSGTPLSVSRSRDASMPLPLVLTGSYVFNWQAVLPGSEWRCLVMRVTQAG